MPRATKRRPVRRASVRELPQPRSRSNPSSWPESKNVGMLSAITIAKRVSGGPGGQRGVHAKMQDVNVLRHRFVETDLTAIVLA